MKASALTVGAVVLVLGLTACPAWGSITLPRPAEGLIPSRRLETAQAQVFEGRSAGWYWVYEGVAHAQSFVANGEQLQALRLRVARLNPRQPAAPLEVEVRDTTLRQVYARGLIPPAVTGRAFRWAAAELVTFSPLERSQRYVLLVHSCGSRHDAPWLVNATFHDLYPEGRHLGYTDDLFFALSFRDGSSLGVGPASDADFTLPINSGRRGGAPRPGRPTLSFGGWTCPQVAASDPLGPIPEASRADVADAGRPRSGGSR